MSFASPQRSPLAGRGAVERLIELPAFAHGRAADGLFAQAMRQSAKIHYKKCPEFRGIWEKAGFSPEKIRSAGDLKKIPFIFVTAFKERRLISTPEKDAVLTLTSSGTSGQKSMIVLDETSLLRVRRIAWRVFDALGMADEAETDYLCFTYDPRAAKNLGTAFTDELLTGLTETGEVFYAIKPDGGGGFYFDSEGALSALERFEKRGRPSRILGFPAHALSLCEKFRRENGRNARLNPESWVITGGGWKDNQDRAVDKNAMRALLAESLGLSAGQVRDLFGMVEHGVPYVDCPLGKFHVPVYGKIFVRHPATLEPLGFGERGLLQFMTPYLSSYPSISLLSSDFGWLEEKCSCGLKGPVMHVAGRAGVKKLKGCAVSAATLL